MKYSFSLLVLLLISSSTKSADDKRMPSIFMGTKEDDSKTVQRPLTPPVGFQKQDDDVSAAQKEKSISKKETEQQESDTDTTNKGPKKKKKKKKQSATPDNKTSQVKSLPSVQESDNEDNENDKRADTQEGQSRSPLTPGTEMLQHNQEIAARNASLARHLIDDLVAEDKRETEELLRQGAGAMADAPTNADDDDTLKSEYTQEQNTHTTDMESSLRASDNEGDESDGNDNQEKEQPTCSSLISFVAPSVRESTTPSNSLDNSPTMQTTTHSPILESEHEDCDDDSPTTQESSNDSSGNEETVEELIKQATSTPDTALPAAASIISSVASTTSTTTSLLTMTTQATITASTMSAATSSDDAQKNHAQELVVAASPTLSARTVTVTQLVKDPRYENKLVEYAAGAYEKIMKAQTILKEHKKKSLGATALFCLIGTYAILYKNGRTAPGMTPFAATFKACGSAHTFLSAHLTEPAKTGVYKLYHESVIDKGFCYAGNKISSAFDVVFPKIVSA